MSKSKTKNKRRAKGRGFPPVASPAKPAAPQLAASDRRPIRWGLIVLFLVISLGGSYLAIGLRPRTHAPRYTYEVVKTYPHDPLAFTQGLVIDDGFLWESTGRYTESSVRKIDLATGEILNRHDLDDKYFGEGLTILDDQVFQLTWKLGKAFVYDRELKPVKEFEYEGEGWGLANNGTDLIFSNGTAVIKFLDPNTFSERRTIRVRRPGGLPVGRLNELEYHGGKIYANKFESDIVYEIHPETGEVTALIDLSGLWPQRDRPDDGLLNGVAAVDDSTQMFVTGKLCPQVYEIKLVSEPGR